MADSERLNRYPSQTTTAVASAIREIVCPIDFSDASRRALQQAVALAERHGAHVRALHVLPRQLPPLSGLAMMTGGSLEPDAREKFRADELERLDEFVAPLKGRADVETCVDEGDMPADIVSEARASNADLIVLGTHGHGALERLALGSASEKTLRKAPCPVLALPPQADTPAVPAFRRILCAIDFSESAQRALECALRLADENGARLTLVHVVEDFFGSLTEPMPAGFDWDSLRRTREAEAGRRLAALSVAGASGVTRVDEVRTGKAREEILEAAREHAADVIAIGVHGHGVLEGLFGTTAYHVTRRAGCPVLTARA